MSNPTTTEPGNPIEVTVTIVAEVLIDPAKYAYEERPPNKLMLALETSLKENISAREWLVCHPEHIIDIQVDMTPAQSKASHRGEKN